MLNKFVPVLHPRLSKKPSAQIRRIQKITLKIILGNQYGSYDVALQEFAAKFHRERRLDLCKIFAIKNLESEHSRSNRKPKSLTLDSKTKFKNTDSIHNL